MEVNGAGSRFHLSIDQNGSRELLVTQGSNIDLGEGVSFDDILGAQLIMQNGQNMTKIEPPKENTIENKRYCSIVV